MTENTVVQKCWNCKEIKIIDDFYPHHRNKDSYVACKECCKKANRKSYEKNRQRNQDRAKAWKLKNPKKISEQRKKWAAKNPGRDQANRRKYLSIPENKARAAAIHKEWKAKNMDRYLEKCNEWLKNNPEFSQRKSNIRRARKKGADGSFTKEDIADMHIKQKRKCAICKCSIKDSYHIDHIIPLFRGGSNYRKNLQLTCQTCNLKKGHKDPIDFMREKGFLI